MQNIQDRSCVSQDNNNSKLIWTFFFLNQGRMCFYTHKSLMNQGPNVDLSS